jgi:hypothetical protein
VKHGAAAGDGGGFPGCTHLHTVDPHNGAVVGSKHKGQLREGGGIGNLRKRETRTTNTHSSCGRGRVGDAACAASWQTTTNPCTPKRRPRIQGRHTLTHIESGSEVRGTGPVVPHVGDVLVFRALA